MTNDVLPFEIESIDQLLNNNEDEDPAPNHYKLVSETHKYKAHKSNHNEPPEHDHHVPLPRRRKTWFFISYSCFLIMYLVFILVIAFTYPLKPICNVDDLELPGFNKKSINITEQMKKVNSVSLRLNFINRNPLVSYLYEDFLNVTVYFGSRDGVELASATAPAGFHQRRNDKKVEVHMPAPGLPGLLKVYKYPRSVDFVVELVFSVRYDCRVACTHKAPLVTTLYYMYKYEF